ncbi:MAG: lamin tail domain-containing protein [Planctomycetaceae bacterium]|nr:lamin tail domain-containing protein [Planctomycetaceae bacterium]
MSRFRWKLITGSLSVAAVAALTTAAHAQLVVTEILANPISAGDTTWEWIEVKNTGATPINLDGYVAAKLNENPNTVADISSFVAANTIVPANSVAVLYNGASTNYVDQLFRDAWGLSASVPLIAANGFPALSNSGSNRNFGFWPDVASYNAVLVDSGAGPKVSSYAGSAFNIDYATGFPPIGSGSSPSWQWNGTGGYQDGANWAASVSGVGGAVTSVPINAVTPLNNVADVANPGQVPAGPATAGLLISEIMFDPASTEPNWEWVEIFNNTGAAINFASTPYFLHDDDGTDLASANVTSGTVANGQAAVLFNSATTLQNMIDAWDPGGANGTLFIPVSNFPSLANAGDAVALWDSAADYNLDAANVSGRGTANAVSVVNFVEAGPPATPTGWPDPNNSASIYLTSLTNDPAQGASWIDSFAGDGLSANAQAVNAVQAIHPGGDVGSPGSFGAVAPANDADFNNDGIVNGADFLIWQRGFGTGTTNATGDADGNGLVNGLDLAEWKLKFGGAPAVAAVGVVPEPTGLALAGLAALCGTAVISRGRRQVTMVS